MLKTIAEANGMFIIMHVGYLGKTSNAEGKLKLSNYLFARTYISGSIIVLGFGWD